MEKIRVYTWFPALVVLAALCAADFPAHAADKQRPGRSRKSRKAPPRPAVGGVADYFFEDAPLPDSVTGVPPVEASVSDVDQARPSPGGPVPPPACDRTPNPCERLSWVEQVMSIRDRKAIPHLRAMAVDDAHERVRERSLGALVILGDTGAAPLFLGRLSGDPSPAVRRAAAEGIGLLRIPVPPDSLAEPLIKDSNPLVRAECARAIGRSAFVQAGPALMVAILKDPSPEVRALSAEALAGMKTPWGTEALKQAARDEDPIVRLYVLRGLVEFSPTAAGPLFKEVWDTTSDPELRIEAFRGLLRSGEGKKWSESGLSDSDARIRFLALREWLSNLNFDPRNPYTRNNNFLPRIEPFLADSSRGIRELAKGYLENLGFTVRQSGFVYILQK
ncbi:MAG: HEAT repeat domain-containing protein [Deltaproteobacteria bacterium]|nr:HEAT repeat domain-containing protein [Deltaproteobacteria bacterium]